MFSLSELDLAYYVSLFNRTTWIFQDAQRSKQTIIVNFEREKVEHNGKIVKEIDE